MGVPRIIVLFWNSLNREKDSTNNIMVLVVLLFLNVILA